jgi:hypothetical protein
MGKFLRAKDGKPASIKRLAKQGQVTHLQSDGSTAVVVADGLVVEGDAEINNGDLIVDPQATEPTAGGDAGTPGAIRVSDNYIYVKTPSGTWKRVLLTGIA